MLSCANLKMEFLFPWKKSSNYCSRPWNLGFGYIVPWYSHWFIWIPAWFWQICLGFGGFLGFRVDSVPSPQPPQPKPGPRTRRNYGTTMSRMLLRERFFCMAPPEKAHSPFFCTWIAGQWHPQTASFNFFELFWEISHDDKTPCKICKTQMAEVGIPENLSNPRGW